MPWFPISLLFGGVACGPQPGPRFFAGASPPGYTCSTGVVGQPWAPGTACHRWGSLAGGGGGRPVCLPPWRCGRGG